MDNIEHPLYFDGFDTNEKSRETHISLDQMERVNELMNSAKELYGCCDTTDIKEQIHELLKNPNLQIHLSSLCSVLIVFHKMQ